MNKLLQPHVPINPKRVPFFYGWLLLVLASLGIIMSIPGQTAGFSAFTEPLLSISYISRTQLSLCYMTGTIASGFLLPIMGRQLDRFGSRLFMFSLLPVVVIISVFFTSEEPAS